MREQLKVLFEAAVEMPAEERAEFLSKAVEGDAVLRDRLIGLVRAHDRAGDFLKHPTGFIEAAACDDVDAEDDGLQTGMRFEAFTLRERIGRGGFGSVWRASQEEPMVRDVAIKVLSDNFAGARAKERFLDECRMLARLQHPSIAKVFDAGTAPSGRPWLAMELVEGQPITKHCVAAVLGWRERVALVQLVCLAIQHAHNKGIVHRDLKPANVLVAMRDGRPQPIVIDFGLARDLGEGGLVADGSAQLFGTIDYMSPEQAAGGSAMVDARADVYALGVLLYELIAGARPFAGLGTDEEPQAQLRRVREQQPEPPTTRSGAIPRLPIELDWIVAKAMAKDPGDRYPTAAALADDLHRLLGGWPVVAGMHGALYRARKFARRNLVSVTLLAALSISLVVGVYVSARGWAAASTSAEQARAEQIKAEGESRKARRALDLFDQLWASAAPLRVAHENYTVRELLDDFERNLPQRIAGEPEVELRVRLSLGGIQRALGTLKSAEAHAERAVELARAAANPSDLADALLARALTLFDAGDAAGAEAVAQELMTRLGASSTDPRFADACEVIASCRQRVGDPRGALAFVEQGLARRDGGPIEPVVRSRLQLAKLQGAGGNLDTAIALIERSLADLAGQENSPLAIMALQLLAPMQMRKGDLDEAESSSRESLRRLLERHGDNSAQVAWAEIELAWLLHCRNRDEAALPLLEHALKVLPKRLGDDHLYVSEAMQRMGTVLTVLGRRAEAEKLLSDAASRYATLPGHPVEGLVGCLDNLAKLYWRQGDTDRARAKMAEAVQIARGRLPREHFVASVCIGNLGIMLADLGEVDAAIELLEEASTRSSAAGRTAEAAAQRKKLAELRQRRSR